MVLENDGIDKWYVQDNSHVSLHDYGYMVWFSGNQIFKALDCSWKADYYP